MIIKNPVTRSLVAQLDVAGIGVEQERLLGSVLTGLGFRMAPLESAYRVWLRDQTLRLVRACVPALFVLYALLVLGSYLQLQWMATEYREHDFSVWAGMSAGLGLTTLTFAICARRPALDRWFSLYLGVTDTLMLAIMTLGYSFMKTPALQQAAGAILVTGFLVVFCTGLLRSLHCLLIAVLAALAASLVAWGSGHPELIGRAAVFYGAVCFGMALVSHVIERTHRVVFLQECSQYQDRERLADMTQRLRELSRRDGLTGLINRRSFDEALVQEWERARRDELPLSLLFIDVDHFKAYNDQLGHQAGDECLREVAEALDVVARRPGDVVARYGGEEFVIILPQTDAEGAFYTAERARVAITDLELPHPGSGWGQVTASVGVATLLPCGRLGADTLLRAADEALYAAKAGGRNRAVQACLAEVSLSPA